MTIPNPKVIIKNKDLEEFIDLISFFLLKSDSINLLILFFSTPKNPFCIFFNIREKKEILKKHKNYQVFPSQNT
jgi:hypothetical protein